MRTQSEGSLSAIVLGLSVKTARLPQQLFISTPLLQTHSNTCANAKRTRSCKSFYFPRSPDQPAAASTAPLKTCVTAPPSPTLFWLINMQRQVGKDRSAQLLPQRSKKFYLTRYRRKVWRPVPRPTEERMPRPAQYAHHSVFFSAKRTYCRGQREGRSTTWQRHMHGARGKQEGGHRGWEGQREREGTRVKACRTQGTWKGERGQARAWGREKEKPSASELVVVEVRGSSRRVGAFSSPKRKALLFFFFFLVATSYYTTCKAGGSQDSSISLHCCATIPPSLLLHLLPRARAGCFLEESLSVQITGTGEGSLEGGGGVSFRKKKKSISQETQQNKNSSPCLSVARVLGSVGPATSNCYALTEKWLHNSSLPI